MSQKMKKVGNYKLVRKIGSGATSEVFEGRKEGEIERFAIKMIRIGNMSKMQREMIAKEVAIIKNINHPHIVRLHQTLETANNYYLVFEFCERGDLDKYLKQHVHNNLLPQHNVRKIITCIADALRHLHARGIAHRDIKLPNVLLKKDFTIKLADFGFAREANGEDVMMQTYCGTPITMAPEVLQNKPYDKKCDVWSLGVVLFILVFGKLPFPIDQGPIEFARRVTQERVRIPSSPPISESLTELLFGCLQRDQNKRLSIEEFLQNAWIKEQPLQQAPEDKVESVSEVLKRVASEDQGKKETVELTDLDQLERLLAERLYGILFNELGRVVTRHVTLRTELAKMVEDEKELWQVLVYYDYQMLKKLKEKRVKLRLQSQNDEEILVKELNGFHIPQPLSETLPEQCLAGQAIINYLKKLSMSQQFDNEHKKQRYQIVIKILDFIQNFQVEVVLFFNNGFETELSLSHLASLVQEYSPRQENQQEYCPALNHITLALECREKEEKFREIANLLKVNCQKRIDAIQRETNGY